MTVCCPALPVEDDAVWSHVRDQWRIRPDTTYLNHGSFGPPPLPVVAARRRWQERLDEQPMDHFVRELTPAWLAARDALGRLIGAKTENLIFCENATSGMNIVAASFALRPGDEVLLTDHEYGAVRRIWERACAEVGASVRTVRLPTPFESREQVVAAIAAALTPATRIVVVSHITSATAVTLPVAEIGAMLRPREIALAIDGPHAIAQLPLALESLDCDYYAASCHKWLSAPFGSGFLYVHPRRQGAIVTPQLSWGRLLPDLPRAWWEEFLWTGTRDYSPYLAIPTAIDFLATIGWDAFRARTHHLARYARQAILDLKLTAERPLVPDDPSWYGTMAHLPLPPGDSYALQRALWERHQIEVPIVAWDNRRWIRVSCHLYNTMAQIDMLVRALHALVARDRM